MKRELRQLELKWWHAHDKAARKSYRMLMKVYEMPVKTMKKNFYAASIESVSSCPAQLFRIIQLLSSLPESKPN